MTVITISRAHLRAVVAVLLLAVVVGLVLGTVADARYEAAAPPCVVPEGPPADSFARADGTPLGTTDDGRPWVGSTGLVIRGEAAALSPDAAGWGIGLVELGTTDGEVSAVIREADRPMSLIVRALDAENHVSVQPAVGRGLWEVVQVTDGERQLLARTTLTATDAGTAVRVELDGETIRVRVNGREVLSTVAPGLEQATAAGLALHPNGGTARWDDFYAVPAS